MTGKKRKDNSHDKKNLDWLEKAAEKKRKEKEALSRVFFADKEARKKDMDSLHELMKKEEISPEEKGGPLYTPISKDLDLQREKRKAFAKVFSSEQERREKQRQALKSWIMGDPDKKDGE